MKNNSNKITLTYLLILTFVALIGHKILVSITLNSSTENIIKYSYLKDFALILFSGVVFKFILYRNDLKNRSVFEKLKESNNEIKESNERYDIVAKATSDTIWDWKIEDDSFIWNKGIQGIFGYKKENIGITSKWWFDRIHPEDSWNKKQKNGKMNIDLCVLTEAINMYLTEVF
jgi:PAS domain-containing protein